MVVTVAAVSLMIPQGHHMKLFVSYAVQHTLGSQVHSHKHFRGKKKCHVRLTETVVCTNSISLQILAKISTQEKFRTWLEKTEVGACLISSVVQHL